MQLRLGGRGGGRGGENVQPGNSVSIIHRISLIQFYPSDLFEGQNISCINLHYRDLQPE